MSKQCAWLTWKICKCRVWYFGVRRDLKFEEEMKIKTLGFWGDYEGGGLVVEVASLSLSLWERKRLHCLRESFSISLSHWQRKQRGRGGDFTLLHHAHVHAPGHVPYLSLCYWFDERINAAWVVGFHYLISFVHNKGKIY